jgi:CCR4-NOT transcription complex subunit 11
MQELFKTHSLMDPQILKEKSLETSFQAFKSLPKTHYFQAAYEILAWLQDDLLTQYERANAIFILLEFSKHSENVFLQTVADIIDISPYSWEKMLLQEWLKNKEIGKLTPNDVFKFTGEAKEIDHIKRSRTVRPVINGGSNDKNNSYLGKYDPEFLRPIPEFIEISPNETQWMSPMTVPEVLWDNENQKEKAASEEAREYLRQAILTKLSSEHSSIVSAALKNDSKLVFKSGITHKNLGDLVEKNATIAVDIILAIMSSSKVQDYFGELVSMPMSLNTLEVVNKIALMMDLPPEFLHLFISNCMNSCKNMKEKHTQTRFVRLFCVFINSLLKNKILNNQELYIEIEHFCTEFNTMKEAIAVYKAIKSIPNE